MAASALTRWVITKRGRPKADDGLMRVSSRSAALVPFALLLAACGGEAEEAETVKVAIDEAGQATGTTNEDAAEFANVEGVTPMAERTATIGLLNKRNNKTQDLELKPGESQEVGNAIVRLSACERTAPQEFPQETGAFVQLDVQERGDDSHTRVFSGWLFKESPSRNVVEHPVYDVWVKECRMRFPGEPELSDEDEEKGEDEAADEASSDGDT